MSEAHDAAARMIRDRQRHLAEEIVNRLYEQEPKRWHSFGEAGRAKSIRDAEYHLSYLETAVAVDRAPLFVNYVGWVKVLFAHLGFGDEVLERTLQATREVLNEQMTADLAALPDAVLQEGLDALPRLPRTLPADVAETSPLGELASTYLQTLLRGDHREATRLIMRALDNQETDVKGIYLDVFQPVQHEIGRRWQLNEISVAQEHFCTAITQSVMSQLYSRIFDRPSRGCTLVITCVDGELHEIGARMVADFFEMAGWDTFFLGASTPPEDIVEMIHDYRAHMLAISANIPFHVSAITALIRQVRETESGRDLPILVGGRPFNQVTDLWQLVGADGWAPDAPSGVDEAHRLLGIG